MAARVISPGERVFWLSFCDADRPKGTQFLGACVVAVTPLEAAAALFDVTVRFPLAEAGSEWIAAAITKAHTLECNPGGEVASLELPPDHPNLDLYPFGVLLARADIERIGRQIKG